MALNTAFQNNLYSRAFGGTTEPGVADPYITGYGFVWFNQIPAMLATGGYNTSMSQTQIQATLGALAYTIDIPAISLNKQTIEGTGGVQFNMPTRLNIGNTMTITFLELSGTPITNIINGWGQMLRDIRTGLSNLIGTDYRKANYSSTVYYWTTKPDGYTIEQAWALTGVWPETRITNQLNTDVTNNSDVRLDVTFSIDNIYPYSNDVLGGNSFIGSKLGGLITTILSYKETLQTFAG